MLECISLGDKVELLTELDSEGEQEHYFSSIQEIEDNKLIIAAPIVKGKIEPLEVDTDYGICIYTKKGLYRCEVQLVSREKKGNLFLLNFITVTEIVKYQRRQYYRMDCIIKFTFKGVDKKWYDAVILDISGGGIRFSTNSKVEQGDYILNNIKFDLKGNVIDMLVYGNVININHNASSSALKYEVRVAFEDISKVDRENIIKYIFDEERRRRKNKVKV